MKLFLSLILVVVSLTACQNAKDDPIKDKTEDDGTVNTTDYSACRREGLSKPNDLVGEWQLNFKTDRSTMVSRIRIDMNKIRVSNSCFFKGRSITAVGTSPSRFDSLKLYVENKIEDAQTLIDGENRYDCSVNFDPGYVHYRFEGSCLVLSKDNEGDLKLIPAN